MAKSTFIIVIFLATSALLSMAPLMSASAAQIPTTTEILSNEINGNNIVNTPNHNSSTHIHNFPWNDVPRNRKSMIGQKCDQDADCGNFSICVLKVFEDDLTVKVCQCDRNDMKKINFSCFTKPGHQCYYPDVNNHGYRYIQCHPGSACRASVNKSAPENGYCMCDIPDLDMQYRELNKEFEMAQCTASFFMYSSYNLAFVLAVMSFREFFNSILS